MNPKWIAFIIFVWIIGLYLGMTYESDASEFTRATSGNSSCPGTMEKLFTPVEQNYEGVSGNTKWWIAGGNYPDSCPGATNYWATWLEVSTWDFPFLKPYDTNSNGVIDPSEEDNNDIGKHMGYVLRAFGIIGTLVFVVTMLQLFQSFLPWT
jgi:hypothetical protein